MYRKNTRAMTVRGVGVGLLGAERAASSREKGSREEDEGVGECFKSEVR